ncbi:MAG: hypothetical protein RIQ79_778 [Verrucomicrobiota bacterium]
MIPRLFFLLMCAVMLPVSASAAQAPRAAAPVALSCDFRVDPLGVDSAPPRLGWQLAAVAPDARGLRQTAYRILVASSLALLAKDKGDLWDSGRVVSDQSTLLPYAGRPLRSSETCHWKVQVWTDAKKPSPWSPPARWTMGLLAPADWQAHWIGAEADAASLLLRREFPVRPRLTRALVHVTGLGHYELFLNGRRVGEDLLAPGWTDYRKTILYDSFDVTALLRAGSPNAVGIVLGNGMYRSLGGRYSKFTGNMGPQKAIAHLRLDYADGTTEIVGTDETWRVAPGPITFSDVYGGEDYDARRAQKGWNLAGFDASAWSPAVLVADSGARLAGLSESAPPIRAFERLKPVAAKELRPGVTVYDLGQNTSLIPRLAVRGAAGSTVRITPSELIKPDGEINDTMCRGKSYWTYTLAGGGEETWFPQFFYRGARYLRVECAPAPGSTERPVVASIEGVVVHSASPVVGEFSSSSDLFNRTQRLVHWAQLSNLVSLISDCPTREKLGWLEQYHLNGPALRYEWDLAALYTKCLTDIADAQTATGMVPSIAPEYVKFGGDGDANAFRNSPEWGSACILSPWQQYEFAGDIDLLRRHYDVMKRYVAYLGTKARGHIVDFGLGDWYDIGPKHPGPSQLTPKALTATAFYQHDAAILARIARLLGKNDDAKAYTTLAHEIHAAFNQKFYDAATHRYATGSQCANALPLVMDLVPPADRDAVLANLVRDVETRGLTAGDVGYRYLLRALADGGRSDVIFTMNHQSEKPGYGYQLAHGATSLTEAWDALPGSSQNHFMLGQINEWFYHDLAGIQPDPVGPGFKRIIIRPAIVGDLAWVKAAYASPHGRIVSAWKREGSRLTLEVTIPANTTATVFVPTSDPATVTESGVPVARVSSKNPFSPIPGHAVFTVGSGHYVFASDFTANLKP